MPDTVCVTGVCGTKVSEDQSILLMNPNGMAPSLQSHGETIGMTKTLERGGISQWNGMNSSGENEIVSFIQERMEFTYLIGKQDLRYKASGLCEVR